MQIVSIADNLNEMLKPVFWEEKKNISKYLLKFLPRVLSVEQYLIDLFRTMRLETVNSSILL